MREHAQKKSNERGGQNGKDTRERYRETRRNAEEKCVRERKIE